MFTFADMLKNSSSSICIPARFRLFLGLPPAFFAIVDPFSPSLSSCSFWRLISSVVSRSEHCPFLCFAWLSFTSSFSCPLMTFGGVVCCLAFILFAPFSFSLDLPFSCFRSSEEEEQDKAVSARSAFVTPPFSFFFFLPFLRFFCAATSTSASIQSLWLRESFFSWKKGASAKPASKQQMEEAGEPPGSPVAGRVGFRAEVRQLKQSIAKAIGNVVKDDDSSSSSSSDTDRGKEKPKKKSKKKGTASPSSSSGDEGKPVRESLQQLLSPDDDDIKARRRRKLDKERKLRSRRSSQEQERDKLETSQETSRSSTDSRNRPSQDQDDRKLFEFVC